MTKVEFDCVIYQCDICKTIFDSRYLEYIGKKEYCMDCKKEYDELHKEVMK